MLQTTSPSPAVEACKIQISRKIFSRAPLLQCKIKVETMAFLRKSSYLSLPNVAAPGSPKTLKLTLIWSGQTSRSRSNSIDSSKTRTCSYSLVQTGNFRGKHSTLTSRRRRYISGKEMKICVDPWPSHRSLLLSTLIMEKRSNRTRQSMPGYRKPRRINKSKINLNRRLTS